MSSARRIGALCVFLAIPAAPSHAADLLHYSQAGAKRGATLPARGAHAIEFDAGMRHMAAGDVARLALPDGSSYDVVYDRSFAHPNGDTTWVGHLAAAGEDYRVIITTGTTSASGRMLTPAGEFGVTSADGATWLIDYAGAGMRTFIGEGRDTRAIPPSAPQAEPAPADETKADSTTTQIDVLVLYSTTYANAHGGDSGALTRINTLVALANQAYIDSQVAVQLHLAGTQKVDYADSLPIATALNELTGYGESGPAARPAALAQVPTWRNNVGADLVALLRTFNGDNPDSDGQKRVCGLSWVSGSGLHPVSGSAEFAFSVVDDGHYANLACSDYTFTHELGHNLGSMHDRIQVMANNNGNIEYGAYNYSFGYGVSDVFSTIMAYPASFDNAPRLGRFSNPAINCAGLPCGVSEADSANSANNALSINNTRVAVSNFRTAVAVVPNSVIVEFYNGALNHYFITASDGEKLSVDGGSAGPGWQRSGQSFKVGGPGATCRFYGNRNINPATGQPYGPNSHFYTLDPAECSAVQLDPGWTLESANVFNLTPPSAPGLCPSGTTAVFRVYNNGAAQNDSNHRYTIDAAIYTQMLALGWKGEGVVFCTPV